jgi:UDP-glucuronate decarboxylase
VTDAMVGFTKVLLEGTPGNVYNVGNPVPEISMGELVHILERVVGRPLDKQLVEYPDSYPADEPQRRCPDINKARVQLEFHPAVTLEEGLRRFMGWTAKHYTGSQV